MDLVGEPARVEAKVEQSNCGKSKQENDAIWSVRKLVSRVDLVRHQ